MNQDQETRPKSSLTAAVAAFSLCLGAVSPMAVVANEHSDEKASEEASAAEQAASEEGKGEEPKKEEEARRPRRGGPCAL